MSTVVLTSTTKLQQFPEGTNAGMWRFSLNPLDDLGVSQDVDGPTATFLDVVPGMYTATAQRLDAQGLALGNAASIAFSVEVGGVSIEVAGDLSVEVQP